MKSIASKSRLKASKPKLALGFALLFLGLLLFFGRQKVEGLLSQSFETEPVKIYGFSGAKAQEEKIPKRIILPSLNIDLEVKPAREINGYWEVFADSAGWGEGSGLPGEAGNQVIFAHAREGLFLPLRKVSVGMRIYVLSEGSLDLSTLPEELALAFKQETGQEKLRKSNWYSYEVTDIKEVFPNETEVIAPTNDETLTLYTCSGFADSKRLIVIAKRT